MMGPRGHQMQETAAPQNGILSQQEGEPLLEASGKKGKGDTTSLDPKVLVNEAFGTDLNRWILKAGVQVCVDDIVWDINCEHGNCRALDNWLVTNVWIA